MAYNYSIEYSAERIHNQKTRELFKEVYVTFINNNYRSSLVMLYSVLICDLVYKLRDLRDIYSDKTAEKILQDIETVQTSNPKSPEWENKLIEFIEHRTSLLQPADIANIDALQKQRHLSAHPILTNADLLYSPNKETVQAYIRNILEGILINPPFLSNKISDLFLQDIEQVKEKILTKAEMESYLTARYFANMKVFDITRLFRTLWKLVFITDDERSANNRRINMIAVKVILGKYRDACFHAIENEKPFYNNINRDRQLKFLVSVLSDYPGIFTFLETPLRILLRKLCEDDQECRLNGWFWYRTFSEHIAALDPKTFKDLPPDSVKFFLNGGTDNGSKQEAERFIIDYFGQSNSFTDAKKTFTNVMLPQVIDELDSSTFEYLLTVANTNEQIAFSWGIADTLKEKTQSKFPDLHDTVKFPRIFKNAQGLNTDIFEPGENDRRDVTEF